MENEQLPVTEADLEPKRRKREEETGRELGNTEKSDERAAEEKMTEGASGSATNAEIAHNKNKRNDREERLGCRRIMDGMGSKGTGNTERRKRKVIEERRK